MQTHKALLGLTAALAIALPAAAQEQATLEEITVTAQRRAESLQDVPIAITAFTADTLERSRIFSMQEIVTRTPSFTMTAFNAGQPRLFIRGIGSTDDGAAQDNSVAVFIDDVYIGRGMGQASEIYDLERVEVLRGPQGTLYGKNVVGGVVHLISARPEEETRVQGEVTVGRFDALEFRGMATGALTDSLSARLSFVSVNRDGYAHNILRDEALEDRQFSGLRGQLLWSVSDEIDVVFAADYSDHADNGVARKGFTGDFGPNPFGSVTEVQSTDDPRVSETPRDTFQEVTLGGVSARINWDTALGALTSVTAYRESDGDIQDAFTGIGSPPYAVLDTRNQEFEKAEQFSQELRLSWGGDDGRLSGTAGIYYLAEDVDRVEISDLESAAGETLPSLLGGLLGSSGSFQLADNRSLGIFASATYDFDEAWSLTLGARYSRDDKEITTEVRELRDGGGGEFGFIAAPPLEEFSVSAEADWDAFTPSLSLAYQATDSHKLYVSASRGFKSGGFQGQAPTGRAAETPFDPEFAWNYEIGAKTAWLDDRLVVNTAVFFTDYEDLQVRQNAATPDNPLPVLRITNAAEAEATGLEVELTARPIPALDIWGNLSLLDTEFKNFVDNTGLDVSGNNMLFAPESQYNVGLQYHGEIDADTGWYGRLEYRWQDEYFDDPANLPVHKHERYGLLDAAFGLSFAEGRWQVEVWGLNLSDELYATHNVPFLGDRFLVFGPPRTYGVSIKFRP